MKLIFITSMYGFFLNNLLFAQDSSNYTTLRLTLTQINGYHKNYFYPITALSIVDDSAELQKFKYDFSLKTPFIIKKYAIQSDSFSRHMDSPSDRPRNAIYVIIYEDSKNRYFIIDRNYNMDFRDDIVHSFLKDSLNNVRKESWSKYVISEMINVDYYYKNKIYHSLVNFILFPFSAMDFSIQFPDSLEQKLFVMGATALNYKKTVLENSTQVLIRNEIPVNAYFDNRYTIYLGSKNNHTWIENYYLQNDFFLTPKSLYKIDSVASNGKYLYLKKYARQKIPGIQVGFIAQDFSGINVHKNKFSLNSYRGNYLLLDFWATWCGPCIEGIPDLIKLYQKYNSRNYKQISLSVDDRSDSSLLYSLIKQKGMIWDQLIPAEWDLSPVKVSLLYKTAGYPYFVLINPEGIIEYRGGGREALKNVEGILKGKYNY